MSYDVYDYTTMELSGLHTLRVIADQDARNPYEDQEMPSHLLMFHRDYELSPDDKKRMSDWGLYQSSYRDTLYVQRTVKRRDGNEWYEEEEEVDLDTFDDIVAYMQKEHGAEVLPLYLYDHSGISVSTSSGRYRMSDSYGWDWGTVGFVFMTADDIRRKISIYRDGFDAKRREVYTRFRTCDNGKPIGDRDRRVWTEWFNADTQQWTRDACWWRNHVRVTEADRERAREYIRSDVRELDQYLTGDVWGVIIEDERGDEVDGCWGYFGIDYVMKDVVPELLSEHGLHEEPHDEQRARIKAEMDAEIDSMIESELGLALA